MTIQHQLPNSIDTVRVRMFDTTTRMSLKAEHFIHPVRVGHEILNLTDVGFLIEHERLNRRIVYDLGCKKEFWNSPPPLADRMQKILEGIEVEKDVYDVLSDAGVDPKTIGKN